MKKSDRISQFVSRLESDSSRALDARYQGYFVCFNRQEYYEAHDVLEDLWLQTRDESYHFYKGLIQVAGAFVHLRKQFLRPDHPKDGRRLHPAVRLFRLGAANMQPYGPTYLSLDVSAVCRMCHQYAEEIVACDFTRNPWSPDTAPTLHLQSR